MLVSSVGLLDLNHCGAGRSRKPPTGIRVGELSEHLGIPIGTLRRTADRGDVPSHRSHGGHRLFDLGEVHAALACSIPQVAIVPTRSADWAGRFAIDRLDEAVVWDAAASKIELDRHGDGGRIAEYGFTQMLNNGIDHGAGSSASAEVRSSVCEISFRITDDGDGVFAHLRAGLNLERDIDAAGELTKGKQTTLRERHTGKGIFFTSKVAGLFRISANGLRLTVDNARADTALGLSPVMKGSMVEMSIPIPPRRTLRSVFEMFTNEEQRFSRSRPVVKLFSSGVAFVSRSEARRVMAGMAGFEDIDIDFAGVDDVGQGFVDEALRVWPSQHLGTRVNPINMNEAVEFMVRRALPR